MGENSVLLLFIHSRRGGSRMKKSRFEEVYRRGDYRDVS